MPASSMRKPYLIAVSLMPHVPGSTGAAAGLLCSLLMMHDLLMGLTGDLRQQALDIDFSVSMFADDGLLRHDEDAVGDLERFVEFGKEEDGGTARGRDAQLVADVPARGDVDALE